MTVKIVSREGGFLTTFRPVLTRVGNGYRHHMAVSNVPPEYDSWFAPQEPEHPDNGVQIDRSKVRHTVLPVSGADAGGSTNEGDKPDATHALPTEDPTAIEGAIRSQPARTNVPVIPAPPESQRPAIAAPGTRPPAPYSPHPRAQVPPAVIPAPGSGSGSANRIPSSPPSTSAATPQPTRTPYVRAGAIVVNGKGGNGDVGGTTRKAASGSTGRRKWRIKRILAITLSVFVVYLISLVVVFATSVNKIAALPVDPAGVANGLNVLIVGSDSREGLTEEQQNELTTGFVEGGRTDTIMLLNVPLIGKPTLVSIPRDSWVPIPGHGSNKINAAYAIGGPELLIETVEQSTGLAITNYVEVGFAGVAEITDALGGVTLCPIRDYNDEYSGLNVTAGCQTMDGVTSLAYVRMRYQDPKGDLGRIERQQEYIAAVAKGALSPWNVLLPWRGYAIAHEAGSALTVDNETGVVDLTRMALGMAGVSLGWGTSTTVPTEPGTYRVDGQDALKWNSNEARALFNSMQ